MEKTNTQNLSAEILSEFVQSNYENEKTIQWNGHDIVVKRFIPLRQVMELVDNVASACFAESDGQYLPEVKDFIKNVELISKYTNIVLPSAVEESYELICKSGIIDVITKEIDQRQLEDIEAAISEKVTFLSQSKVNYLSKTVNDVVSNVGNLVQQFETVFGGITADDFKKIMSSVSNTKLDERKMMHAYFEEKRAETPKDGANHNGNN